jgi:hypothetical protein
MFRPLRGQARSHRYFGRAQNIRSLKINYGSGLARDSDLSFSQFFKPGMPTCHPLYHPVSFFAPTFSRLAAIAG